MVTPDQVSHGYAGSQDALVAVLAREGVLDAAGPAAGVMRSVDRSAFVPRFPDLRGAREGAGGLPPASAYKATQAYADRSEAIGFNTSISAPRLHAQALSFLAPVLPPGASALDIGCGTGYMATCMALLVSPHGKCRGLDHIPEIIDMAYTSVAVAGYESLVEGGQLRLSREDGFAVPDLNNQYDAIYCGAAAPEEFCTRLAEHSLKPGGRLVIAVDSGHDATQVLRAYEKSDLGAVTFVQWHKVVPNMTHINYSSATPARDRFELLRTADAQLARENTAVCAVM